MPGLEPREDGDRGDGQHADDDPARDLAHREPGDEEEAYYAPGVGLVLEVEGNDRIELARVITEAAGVEDARAGTMYPARAESGREAGWRRATQRLARGLR